MEDELRPEDNLAEFLRDRIRGKYAKQGNAMSEYHAIYQEQLLKEIHATPDEYLPALLNIVRLYRQSVTLNPADVSFRQGWEEAMKGETLPLSELWLGIDSE